MAPAGWVGAGAELAAPGGADSLHASRAGRGAALDCPSGGGAAAEAHHVVCAGGSHEGGRGAGREADGLGDGGAGDVGRAGGQAQCSVCTQHGWRRAAGRHCGGWRHCARGKAAQHACLQCKGAVGMRRPCTPSCGAALRARYHTPFALRSTPRAPRCTPRIVTHLCARRREQEQSDDEELAHAVARARGLAGALTRCEKAGSAAGREGCAGLVASPSAGAYAGAGRWRSARRQQRPLPSRPAVQLRRGLVTCEAVQRAWGSGTAAPDFTESVGGASMAGGRQAERAGAGKRSGSSEEQGERAGEGGQRQGKTMWGLLGRRGRGPSRKVVLHAVHQRRAALVLDACRRERWEQGQSRVSKRSS